MINIEKARNEFMDYVKEYNITSGRIKLKVDHILRVSKNSKFIAEKLKLSEEKIRLAELIGLFHDIGRFEQVRIYDTFSDKDTGLDHATYSLKVLYEDGLIKRFIDTSEYDNIIKVAVYNHNKASIEENLEEESLLFAKIIRDADKLDIFKVINEDDMENIFWYKEFNNLKISEKVFNDFLTNKIVFYKDVKNNADLILAFYAYIYDFNFPYCYKIIRENKYLDKFLIRVNETFKSKEITAITKKVLKICNDFMDSELSKIK